MGNNSTSASGRGRDSN